jgi:hypothetical protein
MRISPLMVSKRRKKVVSKSKADPQRELVYAMEREIAGWAVYAHVELDDLQRISDYVCRRYKVKRVGIAIENKGKERVFGWCEDNTIHLNADYHGDNTAVLAHEIAHYVTDQMSPGAEAHGPTFMHYYGEILDMLNLFPYGLFALLCEGWGVQIGLEDE